MGFTNSRTRPESRLQRHRCPSGSVSTQEISDLCQLSWKIYNLPETIFSHKNKCCFKQVRVYVSYWPMFIIWAPVLWVRGISTRGNRTWGLTRAHFWAFLGTCEVQNHRKETDFIVEHPLKKKNANPDYCTSECVVRAIAHIFPVWKYRRDWPKSGQVKHSGGADKLNTGNTNQRYNLILLEIKAESEWNY